MDKTALRKMQIAKLRGFDGKDRETEILEDLMMNLPELSFSGTLLAYSALTDTEPDIRWEKSGKKVLYPYVIGDGRMAFAAGPLIRKGKYGIPEPEGIEAQYGRALMIVPLIGWGDDFRRLGRGGGYYDRYIAENRDRLITIGAGFTPSFLPSFHGDVHDIPLDIIITADGVRRNPARRAWR